MQSCFHVGMVIAMVTRGLIFFFYITKRRKLPCAVPVTNGVPQALFPKIEAQPEILSPAFSNGIIEVRGTQILGLCVCSQACWDRNVTSTPPSHPSFLLPSPPVLSLPPCLLLGMSCPAQPLQTHCGNLINLSMIILRLMW